MTTTTKNLIDAAKAALQYIEYQTAYQGCMNKQEIARAVEQVRKTTSHLEIAHSYVPLAAVDLIELRNSITAAEADTPSLSLREAALEAGLKSARVVFRKRGDHSEAHLTEAELAGICGACVQYFVENSALSASPQPDEGPTREQLADALRKFADREYRYFNSVVDGVNGAGLTQADVTAARALLHRMKT